MVSKKDLEDSKEELNASIANLGNSLTTTFKELLCSSINEIKNTIIENLRISNENLQLRVKALEDEVILLKEAHHDLEKRTEMALQHGRLEQVIISGIPAEVEHKDLEEKCVKLLNEIKEHQIVSRDIAACHRLGKNNDTILRFVNRKDADDCFENRGKLRDFNREAHGLNPQANIYIRENLSPYMNKLAYYCRVLRREGYIDKITTFKGVIKVSRTVGMTQKSVSVISHKKDLLKIFPDLDIILQRGS